MRILAVLVLVLATSTARARPGFYVGLGGGGTSMSGGFVTQNQIGKDETGATVGLAAPLSTDLDAGLSAMFRLGFNILGYGAIEVMTTGAGTEMFDSDLRQTAFHVHVGARGYPLWHWRDRLPEYLQPLEPSIFLGVGTSYAVYTPSFSAGGRTIYAEDPVGFSKFPTLRFGLGTEYFVTSYFKVALDYFYVNAPYNNFIYNFDESLNFPLSPTANTSYHEFFASIGFHLTTGAERVRYTSPLAEKQDEKEIAPRPLRQAPAEVAPVPASVEPTPAPSVGPAVIDG